MRRFVGLVVVVLLAIGAGYVANRALIQEPQPATQVMSPLMRRELVDRVVRTLEIDGKAGRVVLPVDRVLCAARVFGIEPATAVKVVDVDVVYARTYCVEVKPDNQAGVTILVPIAMHLGATVRVQRPADGPARQADVENIFPSRLRYAATKDDPVDRVLKEDVERRFTELPPLN
ncbi:hypothetical protein Val02_16050 [Virgisporangium aliadipatigenens]|uniref:Uncharacterized protein n=1 Tax=Virgisporangium aliadipatigenens TaxID=741659 RepID=A0A8J3YGE4_9ACTN|nr:hypothetical protein [Virgisporangium aliadipatigenens]GIJ44719.1 hypothetical protein Val02_16050 [Virgisporangium aliadipatigenens]